MNGWWITGAVFYLGFGCGLGSAMGVTGRALRVFILLWPVAVVGGFVKVGIEWALKKGW